MVLTKKVGEDEEGGMETSQYAELRRRKRGSGPAQLVYLRQGQGSKASIRPNTTHISPWHGRCLLNSKLVWRIITSM
jgi:hypothetical protein